MEIVNIQHLARSPEHRNERTKFVKTVVQLPESPSSHKGAIVWLIQSMPSVAAQGVLSSAQILIIAVDVILPARNTVNAIRANVDVTVIEQAINARYASSTSLVRTARSVLRTLRVRCVMRANLALRERNAMCHSTLIMKPINAKRVWRSRQRRALFPCLQPSAHQNPISAY